MAKKPRGSGKRGRSGPRQLHAVRAPGSEFARYRGEFAAWLTARGLPAHIDPADLGGEAAFLIGLAASGAGLTDLGSWTPEHVTTLAALNAPDRPLELTVLPLVLAFLIDTGRWRGSEEQFDAALAAAEACAVPFAAVLDQLSEVTVDPATEDDALRVLPITGRARTLLNAVRPRVQVTSTGALRRAAIGPTAELLGIGLGDKPPPSMWDVAELAEVWQALTDAELLTLTSNTAAPSGTGLAWLADDPDTERDALRRLAEAHLTALVTAPPPAPAPWLPAPLDALLPILAAAALGKPLVTSEQLGDGGPEEADVLAGFAMVAVRRSLDRLAAAGFLTVGKQISATPGLRPLLARVATTLLTAGLAGSAPISDPDPAFAGQAWLLRVELEDADPPVWREVLIDPNTPLGEVHEVIQRLFAWENAHLHEFAVSGRRGTVTRYGAPLLLDESSFFGEEANDEDSVRLAEVVGPRTAPLSYRYDFGDSWDHRIVVRSTQPAEGPLPRCVAGSGAAPYEDSGGVWGWTEKLQAAIDPHHSDYADIRDWLDLRPGEAIDGTAFDLREADARLADLRH